MTHHIGAGQGADGDVIDAFQNLHGHFQAADLVRRKVDLSDVAGDETGYAIREGFAYFVEPFVTGAMALQNVGDVSEPIESTYGYHIIKYVSDVAEGPVDIETVRESISSALLSTKKTELTDSTIQQWVSEANVKTFLDRLK